MNFDLIENILVLDIASTFGCFKAQSVRMSLCLSAKSDQVNFVGVQLCTGNFFIEFCKRKTVKSFF